MRFANADYLVSCIVYPAPAWLTGSIFVFLTCDYWTLCFYWSILINVILHEQEMERTRSGRCAMEWLKYRLKLQLEVKVGKEIRRKRASYRSVVESVFDSPFNCFRNSGSSQPRQYCDLWDFELMNETTGINSPWNNIPSLLHIYVDKWSWWKFITDQKRILIFQNSMKSAPWGRCGQWCAWK